MCASGCASGCTSEPVSDLNVVSVSVLAVESKSSHSICNGPHLFHIITGMPTILQSNRCDSLQHCIFSHFFPSLIRDPRQGQQQSAEHHCLRSKQLCAGQWQWIYTCWKFFGAHDETHESDTDTDTTQNLQPTSYMLTEHPVQLLVSKSMGSVWNTGNPFVQPCHNAVLPF